MSTLNDTPRADRLHIAFFGKTNAGKSSAINSMVGSDIALVSEIAGTTTDPVYKSMELLPIGPVVFIDTAGLDDESALGEARIGKTREVIDKTDVAVMVIRAGDEDLTVEKRYMDEIRKKDVPCVTAYNVFDDGKGASAFGVIGAPESVVVFNAKTGEGIDKLKQAIIKNVPDDAADTIVGDMVQAGDLVILVMPQDIQAPKGRLILPQVQVMRDLLDHDCKVLSVKTEDLPAALELLKIPPALVITDSQVFKYVNDHLDSSVPLTSFSMLMAKYKGDIKELVAGARAIASLRPGDKVLMAESCTHHALKGDIAREKLPKWLEDYVGGALEFSTSSGPGFPADIGQYKLIVHCGGCMVNRRNMLSKIEKACAANVPITNFGVAIAFLNGILDRVSW